ncbi:MAG TPA: trehalose-6-phosphate synthase [Bacteroidota bacterium]|nr:trehalose-6-phosphate synthase [Bacteroidota bacterium]
MKITVRLIVSLVFVATLIAALSSYLQVQSDRQRLTDELDGRATVLAESMQESVQELMRSASTARLKRFVERFENRENMLGVAVYDTDGVRIAAGPALNKIDVKAPDQVWEAIARKEGVAGFDHIGDKTIHVYAVPIVTEGVSQGALVLLHDASYIEARLEGIWYRNFARLLIQAFLIIITTVVVVRWSLTGPIARIADWMRGMRMGKISRLDASVRGDILGPLADEVRLLARSLAAARASAQSEARLRVEGESVWTAERLKEHVKRELGGKNLMVVSNREPYMHVKQGNTVECIVPAGGLVTALDPILRACGGTWLAHGSGDADRETADQDGKLRVPPEEPAYALRRVFLTKEEEEGYYYGFSNEGIWPLCHITHTRPLFRLDDWVQYQKVNQQFADVLLDEIRHEEEPLILIQDYHFCLLPLLIKSRRPDARVALFWHIPWPNPEVFGICPWKQEILVGLLGADILGFHIQFHCNNFLETVDRYLESKVNWEQFSIERRGSVTSVRPFPISIAFTGVQGERDGTKQSIQEKRDRIFKIIGTTGRYLGLGVDRIDYTKGIIERFRGVERFLDKYPEYIGELTFVELGAPSRTHIKRYHDLLAELDEVVEKINWRFRTKTWRPIVFLKAHHDHATVNRFYEAVDFCAVTSLHDGMNLVAKEFVSARGDEDGVLILSQFTGAARELQEALIVNPYDIEELAQAFHRALTMPGVERNERMRRLRTTIKDRNVYRWAANIVTTLAHLKNPVTVEEQNNR